MKKITVCKATSVNGQAIESVSLEISAEIPSLDFKEEWESQLNDFYNQEADAIMQALAVLPQATRHRLLIRMLQEKLVLFNIQ